MAHRVIIIIYSDIYGQFPALTHFKESYKFPEKDCLKLGQLFEPLEVKKNEHLSSIVLPAAKVSSGFVPCRLVEKYILQLQTLKRLSSMPGCQLPKIAYR